MDQEKTEKQRMLIQQPQLVSNTRAQQLEVHVVK